MLFRSVKCNKVQVQVQVQDPVTWELNPELHLLAWQISCCRLSWRTLSANCYERTALKVGEGAFEASSEIIIGISDLFGNI